MCFLIFGVHPFPFGLHPNLTLRLNAAWTFSSALQLLHWISCNSHFNKYATDFQGPKKLSFLQIQFVWWNSFLEFWMYRLLSRNLWIATLFSLHWTNYLLILFLSRQLQTFRWRLWREDCLHQRAMYGVLELFFLSYSQAGGILMCATQRKRETWWNGAALF